MHIHHERHIWRDILTKEFLEEEYVKKGKSAVTISEEFNLPKTSILRYLKRFKIKTRGCQHKTKHPFIDMTGKKFNSLTVIQFTDKDYHGRRRWLCKCDCGNTKNILGESLRSNHTKSCGCLEKETHRKMIQRKWVGDLSSSHWSSIKNSARVRDIEIVITQEFCWDLFQKQSGKCAISGIQLVLRPLAQKTASLDRIDNSLGYTPENVQWVHVRVNQMKNKFTDAEFIHYCYAVVSHQNALKL